MSDHFDAQLLQKYMSNFYGYGNYAAPYWFIGMEEGGGNSFEVVSKRLAVWERRGQRELEDIAGYHNEIGITNRFGENPKLQPTWAKLIRVLLTIESEPPSTEDVRAYQRCQWARTNSNVSLMELLPLPSPSTQHWLYAEHSERSDLRSRSKYTQVWSALRIKGLQARIKAHQPKAVIFYGFGYLLYWKEVAGVELQPALSGAIYSYQSPSTLYIVLKHPVAKGVTSEYFHEAGWHVRSALLHKVGISR